LRAKTDLELTRLVAGELNLGVRLASGLDGQSHIRAEKAYAEAAKLLPVVYHLDQTERQRLESNLKRLRVMLDHLPALTQTA